MHGNGSMLKSSNGCRIIFEKYIYIYIFSYSQNSASMHGKEHCIYNSDVTFFNATVAPPSSESLKIQFIVFLKLSILIHTSWTKWTSFRWRHFAIHFMNEKNCILIRISLKFVPNGPKDNRSALVRVMAWCRAIIWTNADPFHWRIFTALGGNELTRHPGALQRQGQFLH